MSEGMISLLISGTIDTIIMTFVSAVLGFILGIPTGVLLYVTRRGQVMENTVLYSVISAVVNVFRSIPFIILLVWISRYHDSPLPGGAGRGRVRESGPIYPQI